MAGLFIAGAGTDVGKTYVASALLRELVARHVPIDALKPVVSGFDETDWALSDPGCHLTALGRPLNREALGAISPWRFKAPLSPEMAAELEGRTLDFAEVLAFCQARIAATPGQLIVIEGAGGVASPVDPHTTGLDLMAGLAAPVVLVTGSYLGAISHGLTAIECVRARGLSIKAVVVSESEAAGTPFDATVAAIARLSKLSPVIPARRGDLAWAGDLANAVLG